MVKNQETIIYYGSDQPQFRPQPFQAPPRLLEQRQQFDQQSRPIEQSVPRIRIPIHVPKRAQHISPTQAPQKIYREEIPEYVDDIIEQEPVVTTTTAAPTTRRPLPPRINFEEAFVEAPVRRVKKPHTPIIPDTPQVLSNDVEVINRFDFYKVMKLTLNLFHYRQNVALTTTKKRIKLVQPIINSHLLYKIP